MKKTKDILINGITADEKILKEGMLHAVRIYSYGDTKDNKYTFKYICTDKGIWTKGKKLLLLKSKTNFMPYADIALYRESKTGDNIGYIFILKSGRPPVSCLYFDDPAGVAEVLDGFIKKDISGQKTNR